MRGVFAATIEREKGAKWKGPKKLQTGCQSPAGAVAPSLYVLFQETPATCRIVGPTVTLNPTQTVKVGQQIRNRAAPIRPSKTYGALRALRHFHAHYTEIYDDAATLTSLCFTWKSLPGGHRRRVKREKLRPGRLPAALMGFFLTCRETCKSDLHSQDITDVSFFFLPP